MSARRKGWAAALAAALALGTPAGLEAAVLRSEQDPVQQAPIAATALAGQAVRVTLLTPLDGRVHWFVDGAPLATGAKSALIVTRRAGPLRVDAELRRNGRLVATGAMTLAGHARQFQRRRRAVHAGAAATSPRARQAVRAAQAGSVTIRDFQFSPASVTVHVGDTVTWVNNGPSAHTATASNGGFDTGALRAGQSASHTFTQAGTYSYVCSFHPFMHGTVVVTGAAASPAPSQHSGATTPSTTSSAAPAAPAQAAANGSSLPMTGLDIAPVVAAGGLLLVTGGALRRKLR